MQEIKQTPQSKRTVRFTRYAFWDETLSEAWKAFHVAERVFLKSNKNEPRYPDLKRDFHTKQRIFDKYFKKKKRSFERKRVHDLEEVNTKDPNEFWKYIKKAGSEQKVWNTMGSG